MQKLIHWNPEWVIAPTLIYLRNGKATPRLHQQLMSNLGTKFTELQLDSDSSAELSNDQNRFYCLHDTLSNTTFIGGMLMQVRYVKEIEKEGWRHRKKDYNPGIWMIDRLVTDQQANSKSNKQFNHLRHVQLDKRNLRRLTLTLEFSSINKKISSICWKKNTNCDAHTNRHAKFFVFSKLQ